MKPTLVLRPRRSVRVGVAMTAALAVAVTTAATYPAIADPPPVAPFDATVLEPVDQQVVTRLEEFSWDDYNPLPATYDWANDYTGTEAAYKGALVIIDFPDQPFMVTQDPAPAGAELTGADRPYTKIARDQVPQYYANLLNTPSALNHGRTVNEYWMEQSGGRLSLDFTTFGPYTMPYSRAVYGMYDDGNNFSGYSNSAKLDPFGNNRDSHGATGNNQFCPWFTGVAANATTGYSSQQCNRSHRTDALALWRSDLDRRVADPVDPLYGAYDNLSATAKASNNRPLYLYDMVFYVLAGRDESSTWEEFGRAIFTQDPVTGEPQVPNSFGPPRDGSIRQAADGTPLNYYGDPMANWSKTRYIPWTSWIAASNQWPNASFPNPNNGTIGYAVQAGNSLQSESSGMGTYAHEFSHIRGISDNYGNPFDVITGFVNGPTGPLRDTSGPFDILSRGSSLGPEGMHQRWHVPSTTGGSQ
ncbi:MAG: hypothetical protein LBT54_01360, partial [Bifidobacteriaceae bacterium]|nr:hypothetical protein [Bifidobacteriaceae bacterium]